MNARTSLSVVVFASLFTTLSISTLIIADPELHARLLDDKQAPTVLYHPSSSEDKKPFTVTVKDDAGIQSVTLFYREPDSSRFITTRMKRVGESNSYIIELGKRGHDRNLDFNILAVDLAGNSQLVSGNSATPINSGQATASTPRADSDL